MVDEIHDRTYRSGRTQLHAGIDAALEKLSATFKAVHNIQFAAPWAKRSQDAGCA